MLLARFGIFAKFSTPQLLLVRAWSRKPYYTETATERKFNPVWWTKHRESNTSIAISFIITDCCHIAWQVNSFRQRFVSRRRTTTAGAIKYRIRGWQRMPKAFLERSLKEGITTLSWNTAACCVFVFVTKKLLFVTITGFL